MCCQCGYESNTYQTSCVDLSCGFPPTIPTSPTGQVLRVRLRVQHLRPLHRPQPGDHSGPDRQARPGAVHCRRRAGWLQQVQVSARLGFSVLVGRCLLWQGGGSTAPGRCCGKAPDSAPRSRLPAVAQSAGKPDASALPAPVPACTHPTCPRPCDRPNQPAPQVPQAEQGGAGCQAHDGGCCPQCARAAAQTL